VKALFRNPVVQGVLAAIFAGYLKFCLRTLHWTIAGGERAEGVWDKGGGVVVCFWHSRIALAPGCWPAGRAQPPRVLISLSPDGQFIAAAIEKLGFPAIRGSAAKSASAAKAKGGAQAFRAALKWLKGGGGVAITPDGPRGPARQMSLGAATLAGASGAPVLLAGMACRPAIRLKSWDRGVIPVPFGRAALVWDGPHHVERAMDTGAVGQLTDAWGAALNAATDRAEALVR
jgi:lysophospholipid acyltransferase (LPLAT)-like uncharacterized protein